MHVDWLDDKEESLFRITSSGVSRSLVIPKFRSRNLSIRHMVQTRTSSGRLAQLDGYSLGRAGASTTHECAQETSSVEIHSMRERTERPSTDPDRRQLDQ